MLSRRRPDRVLEPDLRRRSDERERDLRFRSRDLDRERRDFRSLSLDLERDFRDDFLSRFGDRDLDRRDFLSDFRSDDFDLERRDLFSGFRSDDRDLWSILISFILELI